MASSSAAAKPTKQTSIKLSIDVQSFSQKKPIIETAGHNFYLQFKRSSKRCAGDDVVHYNTQNCLGNGTFGSVFLAINTWGLHYNSLPIMLKDKRQVIKVFDLNNPNIAEDVKGATKEMIRQMNRQVIMQEYELAREAGYLGVKLPVFTPNTAYLVMKRLPGTELLSWFEDRLCSVTRQPLPPKINGFDVTTKLRLTYQLMLALKRQVRDKKIIHRDIKLENILIDLGAQIRVFIIDFGFARFFNKKDGKAKGSLAYVAPETLYSKDSSYQSDVFSLARVISAFWLKNLNNYMSDDTDKQIHFTINAGHYLDIQEFERSVAIRDILLMMLQIDPRKRYSINQALLHFARHFPEVDDASMVAREIIHQEKKRRRQERQQRHASSSSQALAMAAEMNIKMTTIYSPKPKSTDSSRGSDSQDSKLNYAIAYIVLAVCLGLLMQAFYNRYSFFSPAIDSPSGDLNLDASFTLDA